MKINLLKRNKKKDPRFTKNKCIREYFLRGVIKISYTFKFTKDTKKYFAPYCVYN